MFSYVQNSENSAKIKVIGVGGAGGNAINNMIESDLRGVDFIVTNTDIQALEISKAPQRIQIGDKLTEGLGAGANPQIGREAALESAEAIRNALKDSHMVFITAGFGGGTGTGAAPVIAEICKELGSLTVAVVTRPFSFEGRKRMRQAEEGLEMIAEVADTVITIPNDRLKGLASKNATMIDMFRKCDEVLLHSVKGITDLILMPGLVNLDFADVKTTMQKAGMAIMGIGIASGENRALEAAERAISHPLLDDMSIAGAKGVLMNITSNSNLTMEEMTEASERIYTEVGEDAEIIWGAVVDDTLDDEMRVTVIATGIGSDKLQGNSHGKRAMQAYSYGRQRNVPVNRMREEPRQSPRRPEPEAKDPNSKMDYYDRPTFERKKREAGEDDAQQDYPENYDAESNENDDLDIPTFLRRRVK